jgi:hypothetical protein
MRLDERYKTLDTEYTNVLKQKDEIKVQRANNGGTAAAPSGYQVGQTVSKNGKNYKITGFQNGKIVAEPLD